MKIVVSVLSVLLVVTLGAAGFFYLKMYQPLVAEHAVMKAGMPEFDRAKTELKKMKEKENKETAWIKPAVELLTAGLHDEITAGKAEVIAAGNVIVVNIAEDKLYMPGSYTFAKDSTQLRAKLVGLLSKSELKGKELVIGNTTEGVQAQTRGRMKTPAKDARTLAAERSGVLIRDFEKSQITADSLVAAAYSSKQPEIGISLKSHKTVIIIGNPPTAASVPQAQPKPAVETKSTATVSAPQPPQSKPTSTAKPAAAAPAASQQPQPREIPVRPAQPKSN